MAQILESLSHRHHAIIDCALAGNSNRDIAAAFGMTESTISLLLRQPLVQDELSRRRSQQRAVIDQSAANTLNQSKAILEAAAAKAASVHVDFLDSPDPKLRMASASEILKRTHDNKFLINQNGQPNVSLNLSGDALLNLQIVLRESYKLEGKEVSQLETTSSDLPSPQLVETVNHSLKSPEESDTPPALENKVEAA